MNWYVRLTSMDVEWQGLQVDEGQLDQRLNQRNLSCAGTLPEQQRGAVSVCLLRPISHWTLALINQNEFLHTSYLS